jgi:hypothetical protein
MPEKPQSGKIIGIRQSRREQLATGPAAGPGNMKSALEAPPD